MVVDEGKTLRNLIVGASNRRAVQCIQRSFRTGGSRLLLLGPSGVGKSHLLHAVANRLNARGQRVLAIRAHEFREQCVAAVRALAGNELRSWMRSHDALVVDELEDLMTYDFAFDELGRSIREFVIARRSVYLATTKLWPVLLDHLARWDADILPIRAPSLAQRSEAVARRARRRMTRAKLVEIARAAATIPAACAAVDRELFVNETGAASAVQV